MPSLGDVGIANVALGLLAVSPIISFDDNTKPAQLLKVNYDALRDAVLEDREWTFAVKRYYFNSPGPAPVYGYSYAFPLPAEVLRVLNIPLGDNDEGPGLDRWQVEDRQIICDETDINVRALIRITDPARFSPGFAQALAHRIAHQLCIPLTENRTHKAELWEDYETLVSGAAAVNGMQGKTQKLRSTNLTKVR